MAKSKKQKVLGKSEIINHLLQFIFIFSSVFFAIWLSNRNEIRKLRQTEKQAIAAVYLELQNNLKALEAAMPYHQQVLESINAYTDSLAGGLIDVPQNTKPINHLMQLLSRSNSASGVPPIERSAYLTLQNSEAYVLLDYEIAGKLSFLYRLQARGVENTSAVLANEILLSKEIFIPEYVDPMLNLTGFTFRELYGQEILLAETIREMMRMLEKNYEFD